MKQDPTRTKGQKTWAIQVSSCPVVRVIMMIAFRVALRL